MITLNQLIKDDQEKYCQKGYKCPIILDEVTLDNCMQETSFILAYEASVGKKIDSKKLTLRQIMRVFRDKNLDVRLFFYFPLDHYYYGNVGNCTDIESILNLK
jgi:hypothetical protein